MAQKIKKYLPWVLLAAVIGLGALLLRHSLSARHGRRGDPTSRIRGPNNLRIGLVGDQGADLVILAYESGLFEEQGLLVDLAPETNHQKALRELARQEVDLAVLSDIPLGLLAPPVLRDIAVLAVIGEGPQDMLVVKRGDAGINAIEDLKGKRLGIENDDGERYAVDLLLARHGLTTDDVTVVPLETNELPNALRRGAIAAVADAFAYKRSPVRALTKGTEDPATTLTEHGLLSLRYCLVASRAIIEKKRPLILKTLAALVSARESMRAKMTESAKLVARVQRVPPKQVAHRWKRHSFSVRLSPQLTSSLETQEAWARQRHQDAGVSQDAGAIDWASMMAPELLTEVQPKAVRLPK